MGRKQNATEAVPEHNAQTGQFAQGGAGGPGRPSKNSLLKARGQELARLLVEDRATELVERFLDCGDHRVSWECFKFLFEQGYGRAAPRIEGDGNTRKTYRVVFDIANKNVIRAQRIDGADDAIEVDAIEPAVGTPCLPSAPGVDSSVPDAGFPDGGEADSVRGRGDENREDDRAGDLVNGGPPPGDEGGLGGSMAQTDPDGL